MKNCSRCGETKEVSEFYKRESRGGSLSAWCKHCHCEYTRLYKKNNNEKCRDWRRVWFKKNKSKRREYMRMWHQDNPDYIKNYYKKNAEKCRERSRRWYLKNPKKRKEQRKNTYLRNRKTPSFCINNSIKCAIYFSLKGNKNGMRWEDLVGYTLKELMTHIEKQFKPWMTWNNYGRHEEGKLKWQIDHIKPISSFDFKSAEDPEFKECWALDNLQPLEVIENIKKSNKIIN